MNHLVLDFEKDINISIILIGSFQYTKAANDIDLIIIYKNMDYAELRKIKTIIANNLRNEFGLPVHYTTLLESEYGEMEELRAENHMNLYDTRNHKE